MILLPLLATAAACSSSFLALLEYWSHWDDTMGHGYIVAALCIWLVWRDRHMNGPYRAEPKGQHVLIFATTFLAWLVSVRAGVQVVEFSLLPFLLWASVLAGGGWPVGRRLLFPVGYLYFAMPVWNQINSALQDSSVIAVRFMLRLTGIPAFFDANHIQIPEGTFEVAGGCSGLHFLIVGLALAALTGEVRGAGMRVRINLLLAAAVLSAWTNWVRIFVIILAGHFTHMQHYLITRSHYGFGWALFALAMAVFFFIDRKIKDEPISVSRATAPIDAQPCIAIQGIVLGIVAFFVGWHLLAARNSDEVSAPLMVPTGWTRISGEPAEWSPYVANIDSVAFSRIKSSDGHEIEVYTGLFRSQHQEKELSGYHNDVLRGLVPEEQLRVRAGKAEHAGFRARNAAGRESLIVVSYRVGDRWFSSSLRAQLWYAIRSMSGLQSPPTFIYLVRAECAARCDDAQASLRAILELHQ